MGDSAIVNWTTSGTYTVTVSPNSCVYLTPQTLTVTVTSSSVSIISSVYTICTALPVIFTAIPSNAGASPTYQWYVNSNAVGTDTISYTTGTLVDGDTIVCVMTSSNLLCPGVSPSNSIVIHTGTNTVGPTIFQNACTTFSLNGQTYNSSGIYTQTLINSSGCDSTVTLDLTLTAEHDTIVQTACDNYTFNGTTYTASGTHIAYLTNIFGCDSIVTLFLTIHNTSLYSITAPACDSFQLNGQTYFTTGLYSQPFTNVAGCDSTLYLYLIITNNDPAVTISGITLTSNVIFSGTPIFQWFDCTLGFTPISGATGQSYTPTVNGDYAVVVIQNGCSDTSVCFNINSIGIVENINEEFEITISPNPTSGVFTVSASGSKIKQLKIYDVLGQCVLAVLPPLVGGGALNLTGFSNGIYFVEVITETNNSTRKLIKQ